MATAKRRKINPWMCPVCKIIHETPRCPDPDIAAAWNPELEKEARRYRHLFFKHSWVCAVCFSVNPKGPQACKVCGNHRHFEQGEPLRRPAKRPLHVRKAVWNYETQYSLFCLKHALNNLLRRPCFWVGDEPAAKRSKGENPLHPRTGQIGLFALCHKVLQDQLRLDPIFGELDHYCNPVTGDFSAMVASEALRMLPLESEAFYLPRWSHVKEKLGTDEQCLGALFLVQHHGQMHWVAFRKLSADARRRHKCPKKTIGVLVDSIGGPEKEVAKVSCFRDLDALAQRLYPDLSQMYGILASLPPGRTLEDLPGCPWSPKGSSDSSSTVSASSSSD